ncbi:MAG: transposase [Deltaproteobacteria bacterium]|nr:transposase [Deltaproteobacteria bacterium]
MYTAVGVHISGFRQPVVARFDTPHGSSDGGAVLLKAIDEQLGLSAGCRLPRRSAPTGKIQHDRAGAPAALLAGVQLPPDTNDCARLAHDPVPGSCSIANPLDGDALATQPTLSAVRERRRHQEPLSHGRSHRGRCDRGSARAPAGDALAITIDLDPTEDPTPASGLAFFSSHYDTWCYLRSTGTIVFDDEPDHFPVCAVLRPGNAPATRGAIGVMPSDNHFSPSTTIRSPHLRASIRPQSWPLSSRGMDDGDGRPGEEADGGAHEAWPRERGGDARRDGSQDGPALPGLGQAAVADAEPADLADPRGPVRRRLGGGRGAARRDPRLEGKTLFELLMAMQPERYHAGHLSTLQRRVKRWRAAYGPARGSSSRRRTAPARRRRPTSPGRPRSGSRSRARRPHLLCAVLPYSNWQWATVCQSRSLRRCAAASSRLQPRARPAVPPDG